MTTLASTSTTDARTSDDTSDPLGDRMKSYETATDLTIGPDTFVLVRVDGRAFHTFTRGLDRPFDQPLADAMDMTAVALCNEVAGSVGAFVQSDEITIVATDRLTDGSQLHFGGRVQKLASVVASVATAAFAAAYQHPAGRVGTFDARVFAIDDPTEVHNNLVWRQKDAQRNAISMICQSRYSSKRLHGLPTDARRQLLTDDGIDVNSFGAGNLHGRLVERDIVLEDVTYVHRRTQKPVTVENVARSRFTPKPAPDFVADPWFEQAWRARQQAAEERRAS